MALFLSLSFSIQILLVYLLCMNVVAFFYFGIDKARSQKGARRVPEKTLFFISLIGGSAGALLAMSLFRHKTKKLSFQAILGLILALQMLLIYVLFAY